MSLGMFNTELISLHWTGIGTTSLYVSDYLFAKPFESGSVLNFTSPYNDYLPALLL